MEKTLRSTSLIRFPDCDPFNHLNNARYLDYFINAREDHLMHGLGFNIYQYARETGTSWVVGINRIAYLKPAMLMETVSIDSTILAWREREVLVEMRMWDEERTALKALLWSTFVHVDLRSGRSIPHNEAMSARFRPWEAPLPDPSITFEQRIAQLR
ncbi:MAG: acyl-CoA thioesterase [Flavobacteriales bacterium]|nr:acyl-CoA thioesterase [Flavobacteriales bacterium]